MPYADTSGLQSDISNILGSPSKSESEIVGKWAAAISKYLTSGIIPPAAGAVKSQVESAVKGALSGMSAPGAAAISIPLAFLAGAAVVASMGAAPGIASPPAGPPAIVLVAPSEESAPIAATIASVVAAWTPTGTWTMPPAGPVPWS